MTSELVLDWLRSLGAAVSARQLYPGEHPRVVAAVDEVLAGAVRLLGGRESLALFMAEDRLTCGGHTIVGAGVTAARVFGQLASYGYDRVTISSGLGAPEVHALVSALAAAGLDERAVPATALMSSPHLQLASLDMRAPVAGGTPLVPSTASYAAQLKAVWHRIERERTVDPAALESLVNPLVEIASRHGGALLPLSRLEAHDAYTAAHISNVALLTTVLAEVMGLRRAAVRDVGIAALLHDIGKMRVPEAVLNSNTKLTAEELALVRQHPETGARMLAATPGLPALAPIVAYEHHLQAGGGGYPTVPRSWRINPASAMTHVADVYDALRTNRPYRRALEHAQIVEMMSRDRRTVFDADVLDAFFECVVPRADVTAALVVSPTAP